MVKNRLLINHVGDSIILSWQRGLSVPRFAPAVLFDHPFDKEALADLRWYLEDYLHFPYGIEPEKATKIEQKFQVWGQQLFELVFRSNEKAREFFQEATREGLEYCEIGIASDDPKILNLPWELLYSPDYQFLSLSLAGTYRSLSSFAVRAEMPEMPQDKLNILLVIARPYGERDIALKTIARPMLEALKPIRNRVNLKVLRPPSFDQFEKELNAHKGFYHIVHFDGHGNFDSSSVGFQHSFGESGQGVLSFETADGSPQIVTAAQIAQSLTDCGVPIFVLNACKSAQEGGDSFSSVATRLVSLGSKGVVAMAYSVYAEAAKQFIGRLYEQLAEGINLSKAVAAARRQVLNQCLRPSPKGNLPLQDWVVPVLYQQETYTPFIPLTTDAGVSDIDELIQPTATNLIEFPDEGAYGFIGRDYDILRLERAFRQNNIVLLQGMGGTGKTELACGFGRWLHETQGRSEPIFFTSFIQGAGLNQIVNQVGRTVWGEKFSEYLFEEQQSAVLKYLKTKPCLLIWDNFEPVIGFQAGDEPLLNEIERDSLKQFLKELRGEQSWVLITSRQEERWLDCGYTMEILRGLSSYDAEELAVRILRTAGVKQSKLAEEYLELLKLLDGHPLALRVVLPNLRYQSPTDIIASLSQGTTQGLDPLETSLDYSFTNLSEDTQLHLPFLGFFSERVNISLLFSYFGDNPQGFDVKLDFEEYQQAHRAVFGENPQQVDRRLVFEEYQQAYRTVFGENLQQSDWRLVLNDAAAAGILERLGQDIYKIHPALPWYLRQRLSKNQTVEKIGELEKKLLLLYGALALATFLKMVTNAEQATITIQFEEPNLLQNLRLAQRQKNWIAAGAILQTLGLLYDRVGRKREFSSLRQRALDKIGSHLAEAKTKGKEAFDFWVYLRSADANQALQRADLETARVIYQEIINELLASNDPSMNKNVAVQYHQLGRVAGEQRDYKKAVEYYQEALKIREEVEDFYSATSDYVELGTIAYSQQDYHAATNLYQKAINILEDNGDIYKTATVYHQLGLVAQQQHNYEEANNYYKKASKIFQDSGDTLRTVISYHQLGKVAYLQKDSTNAVFFFKEAMKIFEDADDFYHAASSYQNLGVLAKEQDDFESAVAYFQKAFEYTSAAKYWYGASEALNGLGQTLEAQSNWIDTTRAYIRTWSVDVEYNQKQEWIDSDIRALGRMLNILGQSQFELIWQEVTGKEFSGDVRENILKLAKSNNKVNQSFWSKILRIFNK
jgi:tetratricopeptide (TPR) repeat protein